MQISGWNDLAEEHGFLVVYPEGTGFPRRWRAGGWPGDPMADVVFISDLIDTLSAEYNIDPARIYANGLSNGGGMSFLLGCALSDRIAAIGGVAGAYALPLEDCLPSRPVPMIIFHGTVDAIVPYLGGPSEGSEFRLPVIPEWARSPRRAQRVRRNPGRPARERRGQRDSIHGLPAGGRRRVLHDRRRRTLLARRGPDAGVDRRSHHPGHRRHPRDVGVLQPVFDRGVGVLGRPRGLFPPAAGSRVRQIRSWTMGRGLGRTSRLLTPFCSSDNLTIRQTPGRAA